MCDKTIFEKIIDREINSNILFENEHAIVINDINPQAPIHLLIIPKQKVERLADIITQSGDGIISNLFSVAIKYAHDNNITDFRIVINNGQQAGETVPHLHIHLLSGRKMGWPPG